MTEEKVCEICEKTAVKLYTCRLCGRRVCINEFCVERELCEICLETLCEVCGKWLSIATCNMCGRLICEACSIKVNAGYVCLKCAKEKGLME